MQYHTPTPVHEASRVASIRQELSRQLFRLIVEPAETEGWAKARATLAALPLTTSEYAVSVNRLISAELYTGQREFGAAKYELTQLTRKLASLATIYETHA